MYSEQLAYLNHLTIFFLSLAINFISCVWFMHGVSVTL